MKIDFSAFILGIDNKVLIDGDKHVTLATVSVNALMGTFPDETNLPGEKKFERFKIAMKVVDGGEQELTTEEATEIKKTVGKAYGPLIVGRVFTLIEN